MVFNVPLNNRLAACGPEQAQQMWPAYQRAWLRWNHVRTAIGAVGTALLCAGLV
jgi:uncharacterized membrane protein